MFHVSRLLVAAALSLAFAGPASAAPVLTPVFTVAGVMNNAAALGAYFACTNGDTVPVTVGLEVFGQSGASLNNPNSSAVSFAPGASVLIGLEPAAGLDVDVNLNIGLVAKGSAHILTTSKKIVCSAFVADENNTPPSTMVSLTVAAKGKQKGD